MIWRKVGKTWTMRRLAKAEASRGHFYLQLLSRMLLPNMLPTLECLLKRLQIAEMRVNLKPSEAAKKEECKNQQNKHLVLAFPKNMMRIISVLAV